ncbi:hypothetical protein Tco_0765070 [Tanacetum coccineum]
MTGPELDLEDWNYGSWEFFFDQLCDSYDVSKFIHGIPSGTSTSDPPPFNPDELKVDKIILSWIFSTLSDALQKRLVIARPKSAKEAWDFITSLDSPVSDEDVVHYVLAGLPKKYNQVAFRHCRGAFSVVFGLSITREFLFSRIMPPRRLKKKSIKRLVEKRVAKAIEEYEKSRANLDSAGSSGGNPGNAGGTMNVHGCSHKTFMNGKPHTFNGTEGVVGLRRWIDKVGGM